MQSKLNPRLANFPSPKAKGRGCQCTQMKRRRKNVLQGQWPSHARQMGWVWLAIKPHMHSDLQATKTSVASDQSVHPQWTMCYQHTQRTYPAYQHTHSYHTCCPITTQVRLQWRQSPARCIKGSFQRLQSDMDLSRSKCHETQWALPLSRHINKVPFFKYKVYVKFSNIIYSITVWWRKQ